MKKAKPKKRKASKRRVPKRKREPPEPVDVAVAPKSPTPAAIRAARERYGLLQREAAALIYYTLSGWQRLEQGERALGPALWEYWQIRAKAEAEKLVADRLAAEA